MTLEQVNNLLHNHKFADENTGQRFRFIDTTIDVDGQPLTFYSLEERNESFYVKHGKALIETDPLLLTIKDTKYELCVELIDHIKGKKICTLISAK